MCSIKRVNNNVILTVSSLILDIEGTTSSISFVKDVLFPYVRKQLEEYVNKKWDTEEFQENLKSLKAQAKEDEENKVEGVVAIPETEEKQVLMQALIDNVKWQMDHDRKTKSLKDLQGLIMEEGYKNGELKGHVYDDVEPSMKSWVEDEKTIYIYSSGSVHAQKLLFGHSEKGDMLPLIKGHFDTTVGMKGEAASYKKILEEISKNPSEVAFLTDVPKEARAAKEAGISSILLSREGNAPLTDEDKSEFTVISSFSEIEFENSCKKRKMCSKTDVPVENKPVTDCTVSFEGESKPNDPNLTTNGEVEMMEVEESSAMETGAVEKKNESKQEVKVIEEKVQESVSNHHEGNKEKDSSVVQEIIEAKSEAKPEVTEERHETDVKIETAPELNIENSEQKTKNASEEKIEISTEGQDNLKKIDSKEKQISKIDEIKTEGNTLDKRELEVERISSCDKNSEETAENTGKESTENTESLVGKDALNKDVPVSSDKPLQNQESEEKPKNVNENGTENIVGETTKIVTEKNESPGDSVDDTKNTSSQNSPHLEKPLVEKDSESKENMLPTDSVQERMDEGGSSEGTEVKQAVEAMEFDTQIEESNLESSKPQTDEPELESSKSSSDESKLEPSKSQPEEPKLEPSKTQTENPKLDSNKPQTEEPKLDSNKPQTEEPKLDSNKPQTEEPKLDSNKPQTEEPKLDSDKPQTGEPELESSKSQTEEPKLESSKPQTDEPKVESNKPQTTEEAELESSKSQTEEPKLESSKPQTDKPKFESSKPQIEEPELKPSSSETEEPKLESTKSQTGESELESSKSQTEEPKLEPSKSQTEEPKLEPSKSQTEESKLESSKPQSEDPKLESGKVNNASIESQSDKKEDCKSDVVTPEPKQDESMDTSEIDEVKSEIKSNILSEDVSVKTESSAAEGDATLVDPEKKQETRIEESNCKIEPSEEAMEIEVQTKQTTLEEEKETPSEECKGKDSNVKECAESSVKLSIVSEPNETCDKTSTNGISDNREEIKTDTENPSKTESNEVTLKDSKDSGINGKEESHLHADKQESRNPTEVSEKLSNGSAQFNGASSPDVEQNISNGGDVAKCVEGKKCEAESTPMETAVEV